MKEELTVDEYDALMQMDREPKPEKLPVCVARNLKRLRRLDCVKYDPDGYLILTEQGRQITIVKKCVDGLRAVATDPHAPLDSMVVTFLHKKGHIEPQPADGGFVLTQRGIGTLSMISSR